MVRGIQKAETRVMCSHIWRGPPLILIDFPVSLAVVALWFAISRGVKSQKHIVATIPTFLFGTIGTYWWYVMPYDFSFLS